MAQDAWRVTRHGPTPEEASHSTMAKMDEACRMMATCVEAMKKATEAITKLAAAVESHGQSPQLIATIEKASERVERALLAPKSVAYNPSGRVSKVISEKGK